MNALLLWDAGSDWEARSLDRKISGVARGGQTITQDPITIFCSETIFSRTNLCIVGTIKKFLWNKKIILQQI